MNLYPSRRIFNAFGCQESLPSEKDTLGPSKRRASAESPWRLRSVSGPLALQLGIAMRSCCAIVCVLFILASAAFGSSRIVSRFAASDISADTDPDSTFWRGIPAIFPDEDNFGNKTKGFHSEVRSRWTKKNLYFLFICPYEQLHLKPAPQVDAETQGLWNWDVAEVFIGSDFANIRRYREFEISPQGEWTDLDINLDAPNHEDGWVWNSGFSVSARIDPVARQWYGFMRIPYSSVDSRTASAGNVLRANFFLSEGDQSRHLSIVWQPTHESTFHVPQVFGTLELAR